jgi:uncharacterized protein (DUF2164 family)
MKHNLPQIFTRRIDLHKFEKQMKKGIPYTFYDSSDFEDFKYKLLHVTLENYLFYGYNIELEKLPTEDVDIFIDYLSEQFGDLIKLYYNNFRKKGR